MNQRISGKLCTAIMTAMAAGWSVFWRIRFTRTGRRRLSAGSTGYAFLVRPWAGPPRIEACPVNSKNQEYQDLCDRNVVEGVLGTGMTAYGLGCIFSRLEESSRCVIGVALLLWYLLKGIRSLWLAFLYYLFSLACQKGCGVDPKLFENCSEK